MNRWTPNADQRSENYCYEALGFSRHNIDLEFNEEHMKAERFTKPPEKAGIDLSTMKMKMWYQEPTRESDDSSDDSQLPSSSRASDALSGTDRTPSHKHGLKTCRNVFSQSVRKTGTNVDIISVSTHQCSILFNNVGSFNWKSEFRKAENMSKPDTKVVTSQRILGKQPRACYPDVRG